MIVDLILAGLLTAVSVECATGPTADAIGGQRETFNAAIRDADIETIGRILSRDVVLVAGTHSDRFIGRDEQLNIWKQDFDSGEGRLVYVRTPNCIVASEITDMAMEYGRWRGENDAGDFAAGSYTAKWRFMDGAWRLEVEVFMTENCGGAACPRERE
jgi:ketosteroid isomerase-like protein